MTDTEESTCTISSNVVTLKSDSEEYIISGSCTECQIAVAKEITTTVTLNQLLLIIPWQEYLYLKKLSSQFNFRRRIYNNR